MINNVINVPLPGSPRFENDTAMAIARIRAALGPEGIPTHAALVLTGLDADTPLYVDDEGTIQSITVGTSLTFTAPTLNTIQGIRTVDSPAFTGLTLSGLTATRLMASDGVKALASTTLNSWVTGTANRVTVADDGDGTITLSTPQDTHTGASPEFYGMTSTGDIELTQGKKLYFDGS